MLRIIGENVIPWAGIGALLLGLGSALTGWAAITSARREKPKEEEPHEDAEDISAVDGG
jgi:hypothetical protein